MCIISDLHSEVKSSILLSPIDFEELITEYIPDIKPEYCPSCLVDPNYIGRNIIGRRLDASLTWHCVNCKSNFRGKLG